jgi:hypothetical protein
VELGSDDRGNRHSINASLTGRFCHYPRLSEMLAEQVIEQTFCYADEFDY